VCTFQVRIHWLPIHHEQTVFQEEKRVDGGRVFKSGREWIVRVVGGECSGGGESGTGESFQGGGESGMDSGTKNQKSVVTAWVGSASVYGYGYTGTP